MTRAVAPCDRERTAQDARADDAGDGRQHDETPPGEEPRLRRRVLRDETAAPCVPPVRHPPIVADALTAPGRLPVENIYASLA
ncbi:hypothetical protein GCM10023351_11580 [Microbacterium gilvum]|uniref:Uncharacterized protein n=1 Tax=Microbacterium gilvum TaxID=1336204 RepID=A0ABP9A009_9MICO